MLHNQLAKRSSNCIDLGVAYEHAKDGSMHITAQPAKSPVENGAFSQARQALFIAQYWSVHGSCNPQKSNMAKQMREVSVKIANEHYSLEVPVMVNVVKIKAGTELVFLKVDPPEPQEPPAKRSKLYESKGKGKDKSKKK